MPQERNSREPTRRLERTLEPGTNYPCQKGPHLPVWAFRIPGGTMTTCTINGCGKPHRAKGYCSGHYKAAFPKPATTVAATCDGCGTQVLRQRPKRFSYTFCSELCRHWIQWGAWSSPIPRRNLAIAKQLTIYRPQRQASEREASRSRRTFVAGNCMICSSPFVCLFGSKTCSTQCQERHRNNIKREGKYRRRASKRDAWVANVSASRVFERDGYTCRLCGLPLLMDTKVPSPHAPTIDHIIPLARGGTHEPNNVQAAHFICNSRKGDRTITLEHMFDTPGQGPHFYAV